MKLKQLLKIKHKKRKTILGKPGEIGSTKYQYPQPNSTDSIFIVHKVINITTALIILSL